MRIKSRLYVSCCLMTVFCISLGGCVISTGDGKGKKLLADSHLHPSNYAVQGISLKNLAEKYLAQPGVEISRAAVMPLPLQQRWDSFEGYQAHDPESLEIVGANYYIGSKADLYYYSFTDAMYAKEYLELSKEYQNKIDLMITGFNPMDMYALQHVKRAILTFPGAFSGIGEFTIHKELVSSKLAGEEIRATAKKGKIPPDAEGNGKVSLHASSLVHLLQGISEIGLVATLHNDIYLTEIDHNGDIKAVYPEKTYEDDLLWLCKKAPDASVIWAHTGLGRHVKPAGNHLQIVAKILDNCPGWSVDISWNLVQEVIINPGSGMPSTQQWHSFMEKYNQRILWGSDTVLYGRNQFIQKEDGILSLLAKGSILTPDQYKTEIDVIQDFLDTLSDEAAHNIRYANHVRIFDAAKNKVRIWEAEHAMDDVWNIPDEITPMNW